MKRSLYTLLALLLWTSASYSQTASTPAGAGTQASPYLISNLNELYWIYTQTNKSNNSFDGKYFVQTKDINAAETKTWNAGLGWQSIGTSTSYFGAKYNGNKHSIDGLTGSALFAYIKFASIKNLSLSNGKITGTTNTAMLVGVANNYSTIDSCHASGEVTGTNKTAGLIACLYYSQLSNSSFEGTVTGTTNVGGLVAEMNNDKVNINRCWANASVSGTAYVGGLLGIQNAGSISESFSKGTVSGTDYVGGLLGSGGSATNVYSQSKVSRLSGTATRFGGLTGSAYGMSITNGYATGAVEYVASTNPSNRGFCGESSFAYSLYPGNFWDTQTSGQTADTSFAEGKSTAQMTNAATFVAAGWDFKSVGKTGIWNIGNARNNGYPYFSWEYPADPLGSNKTPVCLATPKIKRIAAATATIYIGVSSKGTPSATQHGLCWNTSGKPTTADSKTQLGTITTLDTIKTSITGLAANTLYYVRAYATTADSTYYTSEITLVYVASLAGNGTKNTPYLITNLYDLFWLQEQCNIHDSAYLNTYFKQTANIDLSVSTKINNGNGWAAIQRFRGNYDGDFHTINGMYINRPRQGFQGLWGEVREYAKISNLGITNANVTGDFYVGALIGIARTDSIVNCYSTGTVRGNQRVGGLVGFLYYSTALWSYSAADVWGIDNVGGFVGYLYVATSSSDNCYSRGTVSCSSGASIGIGSFCGGKPGDVAHSYCTGKVQYIEPNSLPADKGFCGSGGGLSLYNFFDSQTTGQESNREATAMPTSAMKTQSTYTNWNFDANKPPYWKIDATHNDGYPYFWWQTFESKIDITTNATTAITNASATANGELKALGASAITAHGFCWNTTGNPTTADSKKDLGATATLGAFSANITALNPCTTYYIRAFATNSEGTAYGAQLSFSLLDTQKPTISWDKGIQNIAANTALPNYTAQATVTDNCDISKLTITQTPSANSIIGSFPQTVSLTATDAGGNSAQISFEVREAIDTQYIALNAGWNLVSLYVHPKDSTIEKLFTGLDPIEVKDMTSFWRKGQAAEFNTLNKLSVGKGYLVNMKTGGTLINTGKLHNALIPTIFANFNWQLMAVPADQTANFPTFIAPVNGTVVKNLNEVWYYNASGSTTNVITPGSAYFIRLNK